MSQFKILIKPTSGGDKLTLDVTDSMTILELKDAITASRSIPRVEQRLIYRGQVLKDERTVGSYDIKAEHVLHLVRSKPPAATNSSTVPQQPGQDAAQAAPPSSAPAAGAGQQQLLQSLLNMPQVQNIMSNPDVLRNLLNSNPAIRQIMSSNPEMAHILNNPQLLRESLNLAANPSLLREQMRHSDRAMSNLEAHPEGFNALRRMYENIHATQSANNTTAIILEHAIKEPLQNAARTEGVSASNPFASLLHAQLTQPGAGNTDGGTSEAPPTNATPNTAPLPNPWAPSAGLRSRQETNSAAPAAGLPPEMRGLGGMGGLPSDMGSMDNPQTRESVMQLLSNPQYRQAMADFMSSDVGQQAVRSMAENHPQMRQMMSNNPMMRDLLSDPENLRLMLAPDSLQALMGMRQGADQSQQQQNPFGALGGLAGPGANPAGGTPGVGSEDFQGLLRMLQQGSFGAPATVPVANPEETYSAQLSQLQEMGFFNRQENIQALQDTGGNVQAAVDRLLH